MISNSREKIILTYSFSLYPPIQVVILNGFSFPSLSKIHEGLKCKIIQFSSQNVFIMLNALY